MQRLQTLSTDDEWPSDRQGNGSDRYYGFQGQPYNPADRLFGGVYVLTSKDGTKYRIDAASGDLPTVTDTNGNTLTYTDSEIKSSTGQKIIFERDANNVAVKDPMQEYINCCAIWLRISTKNKISTKKFNSGKHRTERYCPRFGNDISSTTQPMSVLKGP